MRRNYNSNYTNSKPSDQETNVLKKTRQISNKCSSNKPTYTECNYEMLNGRDQIFYLTLYVQIYYLLFNFAW